MINTKQGNAENSVMAVIGNATEMELAMHLPFNRTRLLTNEKPE